MTDIAAFIEARLAEREQAAGAAQPQEWYRIGRDVSLRLGPDDDDDDWVFSAATRGDAEHIALNDPAYVLADVAAKRAILKQHGPWKVRDDDPAVCETCHESGPWAFSELSVGEPWPCPTVRALAAPYADRPDYRTEWAPTS